MGYRYIGSKLRIADDIISYIGVPTQTSGYFIDAFSGTGIVASKAADLGWKIKINDMMEYATIMSEAQLLSISDVPFIKLGGYENAISLLNETKDEGLVWREYSPASLGFCGIERKYYSEENAKKIDGATKLIHLWKSDKTINDKEFALLMSTLISAVNDVANIAGTYGCFLSKWTEQSLRPLELTPLELRKQPICYQVSNLDVFSVISNYNDIVYLDPPYTKRQYASYYHILETIVKGDNPNVSGIAGLRPWKDNASVFCYKSKALSALSDLIIKQQAHRVIVSYSDDGHINLDDLYEHLKLHGNVKIIEVASIGRYRPNQSASLKKAEVSEYLIDFQK